MNQKQYDNTNRGVLFINDKGDNPKRPDRTGTINIDGKEYKLSAWIKNPGTPSEIISLSVATKAPFSRPAPVKKAANSGLTEDNWASANFKDDDIAF